ncbi:transcription elongation factor GreA [Mycoplasma sp. Mirounga ES2805-ORL]|uniref:transcription elongation factor GreA n=1 Tax=Mycoplasma sp. Mirounga ES2805-ORL TaxID=754514 RepID=UPI00197B90BC|nr:transcription elongation factor GreA [Mycoplasma sp. Mirounga ES2805-ORL]QSF13984.1 transcription elongation factor GreA [Mycoplasma sp. Mirounga ES2805-ORL]
MPNKKNETIYISQEKLNEYKSEFDNLINVERPKIQLELKEARAQGDLSENAEYDAARDKQAQVEGRISELERILENVKVIDSNSKDKTRAQIGSVVKYKNLENGKTYEVKIMGSFDSNPFVGNISNESPIAKAILDGKLNDEVEVDVQNKYLIKILEIK